jgi:hypothetical protein
MGTLKSSGIGIYLMGCFLDVLPRLQRLDAQQDETARVLTGFIRFKQ